VPKPFSIQLLPFYHGTDHPFKEGETIDRGWVTRSKRIASLYGQNVYEVEPDNRLDPDYGGHTVIRQVEPDFGGEEETESIGGWEVDKGDPAWEPVRRHPSYR
jgi:hypothetical protein